MLAKTFRLAAHAKVIIGGWVGDINRSYRRAPGRPESHRLVNRWSYKVGIGWAGGDTRPNEAHIGWRSIYSQIFEQMGSMRLKFRGMLRVHARSSPRLFAVLAAIIFRGAFVTILWVII